MAGTARMHVALLNTLYSPDRSGELERAVGTLAETLVELGHRVDVVTLHDAADERVELNGVTVHRLHVDPHAYWPFGERHYGHLARWRGQLGDVFSGTMTIRLRRLLAEISPQLLHTNHLPGFAAAAWRAAASLNIPILHSARDYYLMHPDAPLDRQRATSALVAYAWSTFWRRASRQVDTFVGVSGFVHDLYRRRGFFPHARSVTIYNGVDMATAVDPGEETLHPAALRLGYLGRIEPFRGIDALFRGIEQSRARDRVELVLAGEGRESYIRRLRERFSGVRHRFVGPIDPDRLFAQIDGLVVPSAWREPFGRVVVQANAHGVPAIVAYTGGFAEIVEHGTTGYLFDGEDPLALAQLIDQLAEDGVEVSAARCREHAARFAVMPMTMRYVDEYRRLLTRHTMMGSTADRRYVVAV
jgi:glycogen(starch) synthase